MKTSTAGRGFSLLAVLFSVQASAWTQAGLRDFKISHCSQTHCFSASGRRADVSMLSPLMAAESVELKIFKRSEKEKPVVYTCGSFTYHIVSPYLTCETQIGKQLVTLSWDPTSDQLNFFKRQ